MLIGGYQVTQIQSTKAYGTNPSSATLTLVAAPGQATSLAVGQALSVSLFGHTVISGIVSKKSAVRTTSTGETVTVTVVDNRFRLQFSTVYGAWNLENPDWNQANRPQSSPSSGAFANGAGGGGTAFGGGSLGSSGGTSSQGATGTEDRDRQRRYMHLLPGDWATGIKSYTDDPLTARDVLNSALNGAEGYRFGRNFTGGMNQPVGTIDARSGMSLASLVSQINSQLNLKVTLDGWSTLRWVRMGGAPFISPLALSKPGRTSASYGLALASAPTRIRVVGDPMLLQVGNIDLEPDWGDAWNDLTNELAFLEKIDQHFGPFERDPAGYALRSAKALEVTVREFAAKVGRQFADYRRFGDGSRMDMPASLYLKEIVWRSYRIPLKERIHGLSLDNAPLYDGGLLYGCEMRSSSSGRISLDSGVYYPQGKAFVTAQGQPLDLADLALREGHFGFIQGEYREKWTVMGDFELDGANHAVRFGAPVFQPGTGDSGLFLEKADGIWVPNPKVKFEPAKVKAAFVFEVGRFTESFGSGERLGTVRAQLSMHLVDSGSFGGGGTGLSSAPSASLPPGLSASGLRELTYASGKGARDLAKAMAQTAISKGSMEVTGEEIFKGYFGTALGASVSQVQVTVNPTEGITETVSLENGPKRRGGSLLPAQLERLQATEGLWAGHAEHRKEIQTLRAMAKALRGVSRDPRKKTLIDNWLGGVQGNAHAGVTQVHDFGETEATEWKAGEVIWIDADGRPTPEGKRFGGVAVHDKVGDSVHAANHGIVPVQVKGKFKTGDRVGCNPGSAVAEKDGARHVGVINSGKDNEEESEEPKLVWVKLHADAAKPAMFEIQPQFDEEGQFTGEVIVAKGTLFAPQKKDDGIEPHAKIEEIVGLEKKQPMGLGDEAWIEVEWKLHVESIPAPEGDEEAPEREATIWLETSAKLQTGGARPASSVNFDGEEPTATTVLYVGKLKAPDDENPGQVKVIQELEDSLLVTIPFARDTLGTLANENINDGGPNIVPENPAQPAIDLSITRGTEQQSQECDVLYEPKWTSSGDCLRLEFKKKQLVLSPLTIRLNGAVYTAHQATLTEAGEAKMGEKVQKCMSIGYSASTGELSFTPPEGPPTVFEIPNTTYTAAFDTITRKLILTDNASQVQEVLIPDADTTYGFGYNTSTRELTITPSEGSPTTLAIPGDGDTTYTFAFNTSTRELTVTPSEGLATVIDISETPLTYGIGFDTATRELTLTPSEGSPQTVTIPDDDTTYGFGFNTATRELTITPSEGSPTTLIIPGGEGGDGNTTYTFAFNTSTRELTITPSDNTPTVLTIPGAELTYTFAFNTLTRDLTVTPSEGSPQTVPIPDADTTYSFGFNTASRELTITPSEGSPTTVTIPKVTTDTNISLTLAIADDQVLTGEVIVDDTTRQPGPSASTVPDQTISPGESVSVDVSGYFTETPTGSDNVLVTTADGLYVPPTPISKDAGNILTRRPNGLYIPHQTIKDTTYEIEFDTSSRELTLTPNAGAPEVVIIPDDDTTYTFGFDTATRNFTVTPSEGVPTVMPIPDTTYGFGFNTSTRDLTVTPSVGAPTVLEIPDANTTYSFGFNTATRDLTLTPSEGAPTVLGIPDTTYTFGFDTSTRDLTVTPSEGSPTVLDIPDTTYSFGFNTLTRNFTITPSEGAPVVLGIPDKDTTYLYEFNSTSRVFTVTPSEGTPTTLTIPDKNTTYTYAFNTSSRNLTVTPSEGAATTLNIPYNSVNIGFDSATRLLTLTPSLGLSSATPIPDTTYNFGFNTASRELTVTPSVGAPTVLSIPDGNENTTYTFGFNTATRDFTVTPSEGAPTTLNIPDKNTTYGIALNTATRDLTLTPSEGAPTTLTLPDDDTTYNFGFNTATRDFTITPSEGAPTTLNIPDKNTTYGIALNTATRDLTLTPSEGAPTTLTLPDDNTTYTYAFNSSSRDLTITPSEGAATTLNIPYNAVNIGFNSSTRQLTLSPSLGLGSSTTIPDTTYGFGFNTATREFTVTPSVGAPTVLTIPDGNDNTTYAFGFNTATRALTVTPSEGAPTTLTIPDTNTTYTYAFNTATRELTVTPSEGAPTVLGIPGGEGADGNTTYTFAFNTATRGLTVTPSEGAPTTLTIPDANTTYTFAFNTATRDLTVTPSEGVASTLNIPDKNTTYGLALNTATRVLTLTPSEGVATNLTIPDDNTTYTYAFNSSSRDLTITPSEGAATTLNIPYNTVNFGFNTATRQLTLTPSLGLGSSTTIPDTRYTFAWNSTTRVLGVTEVGGATTNFTIDDKDTTYTYAFNTATRELTVTPSAGTPTVLSIPGGGEGADGNTTYAFAFDTSTRVFTITPSDGPATTLDIPFAEATDIAETVDRKWLTSAERTKVAIIQNTGAGTLYLANDGTYKSTPDNNTTYTYTFNTATRDLTVTPSAGGSTTLNIPDTHYTSAWNSTTRVLTFTEVGGSSQTHTIADTKYSMSWNSTTRILTLSGTDGSAININIS